MRAAFERKWFFWFAFFVAWLACAAFGMPASARGYRILFPFCSQDKCTDGARPTGVIAGPSGNFYGMAYPGGANNSGVIFELKRMAKGAYSESVLYDFCSAADCSDGLLPVGSLIRDTAGNLYGTTYEGGAHGPGEVFELMRKDRRWELKILYSFCSQANCMDGKFPYSGLTYAGAQSGAPYDGVSPLFGTTNQGGTGGGAVGGGVAYELQPGIHRWTEQVLYSFCVSQFCGDGTSPEAPLIVDNAGNLYGTTPYGGGNTDGLGPGTVFELSPADNGWSETVLHSFCVEENCEDGAVPFGGVAMDASGDLIGFTDAGGLLCADADHGPCGVVYSVVPNGVAPQYTVLHTFGENGRADDGANPEGSPVLDARGDIFGTTFFGGAGHDGGVLFKLSGSRLRVLHTFCVTPDDGCQPTEIIRDTSGHIFGTTVFGGTRDDNGVAYELAP